MIKKKQCNICDVGQPGQNQRCKCGHLKDHHLRVTVTESVIYPGTELKGYVTEDFLQCQCQVFDTVANKMLQCGCKI